MPFASSSVAPARTPAADAAQGRLQSAPCVRPLRPPPAAGPEPLRAQHTVPWSALPARGVLSRPSDPATSRARSPCASRAAHTAARSPTPRPPSCSLAAALGKTRAARGLRASRPLRPQSSARPQDSSLPLRAGLCSHVASPERPSPPPHREARPLPSRPGSRPPPRFSQARLAPGLTLCTCLSVSREPAGPSEQGRRRTSLHPQDSAEDRSWVFVDVK